MRHSLPAILPSILLWTLLCTLLACSSTKAPVQPETPALRVVSYNIKHGMGQDGELDLARIAQVLRAQDPDVILLQEVDQGCERSGSIEQAQWLADSLGMYAHFAPFMDYDGGQYGLAILSRFTFLDTHEVALPPGLHEPRTALIANIHAHGTPYTIVNVHFDWLDNDKDRVLQAHELWNTIARIAQEPSEGETPVWIIGGDLNDEPESAALSVFTQKRPDGQPRFRRVGPDQFTFPSNGPHKTIDHFLVWGPGRYSVQVIDEPVASDHCPILLTIEM